MCKKEQVLNVRISLRTVAGACSTYSPTRKKVNIANSIGRWCGNVSYAHILTCFQRKSLIKTVGEELLKSCETKWRYLAVTHTHPHPSKRQQTKTPTTHHPPRVCVCVYYIISLPLADAFSCRWIRLCFSHSLPLRDLQDIIHTTLEF